MSLVLAVTLAILGPRQGPATVLITLSAKHGSIDPTGASGLGYFTCERCGREARRHLRGICGQCVLTERLHKLLDDGTGAVRAELLPPFDALRLTRLPKGTLTWTIQPYVQRIYDPWPAAKSRSPTRALGGRRPYMAVLEYWRCTPAEVVSFFTKPMSSRMNAPLGWPSCSATYVCRSSCGALASKRLWGSRCCRPCGVAWPAYSASCQLFLPHPRYTPHRQADDQDKYRSPAGVPIGHLSKFARQRPARPRSTLWRTRGNIRGRGTSSLQFVAGMTRRSEF